MKQRDGRIFQFGEFELDPRQQRLTKAGTEVHLRPKTFAVLVLLVENQNRLVDRREFFDSIWSEVEVTDEALTRCIKEIRRALGDDVRSSRFVKTTPKRGYSFIHPVEDITPGPGSSDTSTESGIAPFGHPVEQLKALPSASAPAGIGLAVLPFVDMSAAGDHEYFCDGVAEEILTALARLDGLRVVARTSAFAFKGRPVDVRTIGRTLGVDFVMEGSVRRADERIRITVQLVSAADGGHVWAESYNRDAGDIFALQDEIARTIAHELRAQLAEEPHVLVRQPTSNIEAHHLYLKGRYFLNRRHAGDLERAIGLFERALARDSSYALPCAAIGEAFTVLGVWGFLPPEDTFSRAQSSATRALEIDPTLADAHLVLALVALLHIRDREAAERSFQSAFRLVVQNPVAQAWYATHLIDQGREWEALAQANGALEMDPLSPMVHTVAGAVHLAAGRSGEARELLVKALDFDPGSPVACHLLGWCSLAEGRDKEAEELLRKAAESGIIHSLGILGLLYARSGERNRAGEILNELDRLARERWVPRFGMALIHAALGDNARSYALVDEALGRGEPVGLQTAGRFLSGLLPDEWVAEVKRRVASKSV